jgi:hypothetical protein
LGFTFMWRITTTDLPHKWKLTAFQLISSISTISFTITLQEV